jgi:hypothetical protein
MDFLASFTGRRLAYTYEVTELIPGERLVMRTAQVPFPMGTTYTWQSLDVGSTRMCLRNRGRPAGFSKLVALFMAAAVRRANRADLANLSSGADPQRPGCSSPGRGTGSAGGRRTGDHDGVRTMRTGAELAPPRSSLR